MYGMGFGWLLLILFIFGLVYFLNDSKKENLSAKDILDKRYANGEIDENEYKTKRALLEN